MPRAVHHKVAATDGMQQQCTDSIAPLHAFLRDKQLNQWHPCISAGSHRTSLLSGEHCVDPLQPRSLMIVCVLYSSFLYCVCGCLLFNNARSLCCCFAVPWLVCAEGSSPNGVTRCTHSIVPLEPCAPPLDVHTEGQLGFGYGQLGPDQLAWVA